MSMSKEEQIQVLYEIAFGFDNQDSIKNNLRKTLSTILRRINCSGGTVLLRRTNSDLPKGFDHYLAIPKFIDERVNYDQIVESLNKEYQEIDSIKFHSMLPKIVLTTPDYSVYVLGLSEFGLMILFKKDQEETKNIIKSLKPVLEKIGENCLTIIQSAELEQSRIRLKSFYQNVPTALYQSDYRGNFNMINPACRKMFGYDLIDNIKEKNMNDIYYDINDRIKFLAQFKKKTVLNNYEVNLKRKNGEKFLANLHTTALRDEHGNILFFEGSIEDITAKRELEEQLLFAKESAERSEKLQSEFLAQISHEIRTPINSILNFLSILREEYKNIKTENSDFSFNVIENSTNRLLRTINLVLNLTEVESGAYDLNYEEVKLKHDIISPLLDEFVPISRSKGLELNFINKGDDEIILNCDKYTTTQILVNLINNAIKYTENGKIEIIAEKDNGSILLSVKDTGIGMSSEYLPNLFIKFKQEEGGYTRKYEGNGLGMALVKKYCELNNIEISVKSAKGVGSTFQLKI